MAATSQTTDTLSSPPLEDQSHATLTPSADIVWQMLAEVDKERALNDLRQLAGDTPICTSKGCYSIVNRVTGGEGLQWAMDYVSQELASLGYSIELRDWSREGQTDQNLIARKTGSLLPDQEVYFVAHLDGVKKDGEERFPAADDNASGAVDLLELARIFSAYSLSRTVVFFFSTGEEEGALGARSYIDQLSPEALSAIQYVVNIDMIGYDENRDGAMQLWPGEHAPSRALTEVMSDTIRAYQLNLVPRIIAGCD
jgi:acetylornithine deacetylase/succinyl-diaminopimelate desuccinylase-like protein